MLLLFVMLLLLACAAWAAAAAASLLVLLPISEFNSLCCCTLVDRYSLRPKILVGEMDVSRRILVLDTSIFIHFFDKYFGTEGVQLWYT